jgi:hypothetical protein
MSQNNLKRQQDILYGGYPVYGIPLGIIMLECVFPRPIGDIGNARTFPYPVYFEILEGIRSEDLIKRGEKTAVEALINAGKKLQQKGVGGIITSCGLLIRYQKLLNETLSIPVATSSLVLLPLLGVLLPPDRKIGVITADAAVLTPEALAQAAWTQSERVIIRETEGCSTFQKAIMKPSPPYALNTRKLCEEVVDLCGAMLKSEPSIAAVLLECTNLAPYRTILSGAFSLPVFDITHCAHLLSMGIGIEFGGFSAQPHFV